MTTGAFSFAILRSPSAAIVNGLTTSKHLGIPHFQKCVQQHELYAKTVTECGVDVTILETNFEFPDWVFIEDVALLTPSCGIILRPGHPHRRKETIGLDEVLASFYDDIHVLSEDCYVDGGDVLAVDGHYFIGLTNRTSEKGAKGLIDILSQYGYGGEIVDISKGDHGLLHLKSGTSYLQNGVLLVSEMFEDLDMLKSDRFNEIIFVDKEETYASNSLWVNDFVLVPEGFENTKLKIEEAGFQVIPVDMSEFTKVDGGLSCLSLRA